MINMKSQLTENNNLEIIKKQDFLIYQDDNGVSRVNVRFEGDDVWLTAEQLTELFDASQQNIKFRPTPICNVGFSY